MTRIHFATSYYWILPFPGGQERKLDHYPWLDLNQILFVLLLVAVIDRIESLITRTIANTITKEKSNGFIKSIERICHSMNPLEYAVTIILILEEGC